MSITMGDLIADTRRIMYGSMADQLNFLKQDYPLGDGNLYMVMDVAPITPGMVLSSGLNVWYVIGTVPAENRVLVYPAYQNSRNDALSMGAPVMIRPRVTDFVLFTYLNDIIRSLSSPSNGLYRQGQWEDNTAPADNVYTIPSSAVDAVSLTRISARAWGDLNRWYEIPLNYADWQPEMGLVRMRVHIGTTLRFDYRAPFMPADGLTTDIETVCGLTPSMADIPPLGAAARLLRTTESRRVQIHSQSDSRRADEVQGGQNSATAREVQRSFEDRVAEERVRLLNRDPYMIAWPR